MPKFKVGDRVYFASKVGIWVVVYYYQGRIRYPYVLYREDDPGKQLFSATEAELTLVPSGQSALTPYGKILVQMTDDAFTDALIDGIGTFKLDMSEPQCDCGGYKTYRSMSPENHSNWCSINGRK